MGERQGGDVFISFYVLGSVGDAGRARVRENGGALKSAGNAV